MEDLGSLGYVSYYLVLEQSNGSPTVYCKANEEKHACLQRNYVHKEVPLIVYSHAIMNPWAMAFEGQHAPSIAPGD